MDLEQISKIEIPKEQKEKDRILADALQTENLTLINFALAIGANELKGSEKLLKYAIQKEDLEMTQRLIPTITEGEALAMEYAVAHDKVQIANWLFEQGVVMKIDRACIKKHFATVRYLLQHNPNANAEVQYQALETIICLKENAAEVLETVLSYMERKGTSNFSKLLEKLADYTVDTDAVDCMEILRKHGLDLRSVNTKYYTQSMKMYLKGFGIEVRF